MIRQTLPMAARQQVEVDGHLIHLTPAECELVTVMLLRQGVRTTNNDLISILWDDGEREPDTAYVCLRQHIWHINRKAGRRLIWSQKFYGYVINR